jgi:hypothetical protein
MFAPPEGARNYCCKQQLLLHNEKKKNNHTTMKLSEPAESELATSEEINQSINQSILQTWT